MGDPLRRRPLCVGRALLAGWAKCTGVAGVCQTACSLAQTAGTAGPTRRHSSVRDGDAEDITRSMRRRVNSDRGARDGCENDNAAGSVHCQRSQVCGDLLLVSRHIPHNTAKGGAAQGTGCATRHEGAADCTDTGANSGIALLFGHAGTTRKGSGDQEDCSSFRKCFHDRLHGGYPHESSGAVVEFRRLPSVTCGWVRLARILQPASAPFGCFFAKRPGHAC